MPCCRLMLDVIIFTNDTATSTPLWLHGLHAKKEYLCHPTCKLVTSFMEMDPNLHYACIYQLLPPVIIKILLSLPKMSLRRLQSSKSINHLAIQQDRAQDLTDLTCRNHNHSHNPPPRFLMFQGSPPLIQ